MAKRPGQIDKQIVEHGTELPPPPPGIRYVGVPILGIVIADDDLRQRINRRFHWPMITLALAVLPIIAIEIFLDPPYGTFLWWTKIVGLTVIWFAFTIEFMIKILIAECRIEYCKRNWLDIIIIILPVLRPLRVASVARTTRVFTLRGVGMKLLRYVFTIVVGLEATDRFLERIGIKRKKNRRDPINMTRYQLTDEVKKLRKLTDSWEEWYEAQQQFLAGYEDADRFDKTSPAMELGNEIESDEDEV